jgi:hypothetical protein
MIYMRFHRAIDWGNICFWVFWTAAIGCLVYLGIVVVFAPFITG